MLRIFRMQWFLLLLLMLVGGSPSWAKKKVHTIGDSTMQTYDETTDKRGWGQMLQQFFNMDNITVNNRGKSGASSKSFYKEKPYWATLVKGGSDAMQSGDFLLIQFAHNDEKSSGVDGDELKAYYTARGETDKAAAVDYRGTSASGTFKEYIRKFITEAKAMGVKPIVVAPICRMYFTNNNTEIRRNGQHDLGDNFDLLKNGAYTTGNSVPASDDSQDYVAQARNVADEFDDVPFIDLTEATRNLYLKYGVAYCTEKLFCKDDKTHTAALGATFVAREFAQLLKDRAAAETDPAKKAVLQELAQDVVISAEISINPTSGDLGKAYQGQSLVKEFNVSAFGLSDAKTLDIKTTEGFLVSKDKQNYSDQITITTSGSDIVQTIFVKTTLNSSGVKTGTLTATIGTMVKTLDLRAEAISLDNGTPVTLSWPLQKDGLGTTTGEIAVGEQTLSNLEVNRYGDVGETEERRMQVLQPVGGSWSANEIDEVSTRYAEFSLTVPAGSNLAANKISYYVLNKGSKDISYKAYYSTSKDFINARQIAEVVQMDMENAGKVEFTLAEKIGEGEALYIRFYPWCHNSSAAATGAYFCLSDVAVEGVVSKAGSVALDYTGSITYAQVDSDPVFSPEAMTVGFLGKTVDYGSSLKNNGTLKWSGTTNNGTMLSGIFNSSGGTLPSSPADGNTITFTLTPDDGVVFMPTKVTLSGARSGTDSGTLTVKLSGNNEVVLFESAAVNRSGKGLELTTLSATVDGLAADAENPLRLDVSILGLGKDKTLGLGNIVIEGKLQGSLAPSVKYTLTTNCQPAEAGIVVVDPEMGSYKEGTEVVLSTQGNFGYRFKGWTVDGKDAGSDDRLTLTMDADKTVTALFDAVTLYTIKTQCVNNSGLALGAVTLSPNDHDGKYVYGDEVTATAEESPVLKFVEWTDGGQNADAGAARQITVESDMTLIAKYEVQNFIAVFDASKLQAYAYADAANYPFAADITWDNERNATACVVRLADGTPLVAQSTGTPVVRNRTGVVIPAINGLYQNGYDTRDIAWQYQFSTKGFAGVTFVADMAAKNAATKAYKAQVSTDGKTFNDIEGATWTVTANVLNPLRIELPANAANQELVTLRIMGIGDEVFNTSYAFDQEFDGMKYCAHSESGVGNVFVLATVQDPTGITSSISTPSADGAAYNMAGQRVDSGYKGLVIKKGKKVLNK